MGSAPTICSPGTPCGKAADGRRRSDPPFRAVLPWQPIHIFVGRRDGRHLAHPAVGGTRWCPCCLLGQHSSLTASQERLRGGERLLAFLDDVHVLCAPDGVGTVFAIGEQDNNTTSRHEFWNRRGVVPVGIDELTEAGRLVKSDAVVWRGDTELPLSEQGVKVLGVPI